MTAKIIYGTAWKKERTAELVISAVLQGFRAIDTACQPIHYREDLVGEAVVTLQQKHGIEREDLFLQTKFTPVSGHRGYTPLPYDSAASVPQQITQSLQTSLANLHTTYLDSYILHSPLRTLSLTLEAWRTLMGLQDEGKVRLIGISNTYDVGTLEALCAERRADVVQNRWYEGNDWDKAVHRYCIDNGIQYQSFWTLTGSPSLLAHPSLLSIAQVANCTPQQAVYKLAQMRGITPLTGTSSEVHMREDLSVENLDLASVEPEQMRTLNHLLG